MRIATTPLKKLAATPAKRTPVPTPRSPSFDNTTPTADPAIMGTASRNENLAA